MTPKRLPLFLALLVVTSLAGVLHAQPVVIASNYQETGPPIPRAWETGYWWHQDVAANHDGYISEIGVYMGLNTTPYEATLVINVDGHQAFANVYKGLTQRSSDRATVFPVTGANVRVRHGQTITIVIATYTPYVMFVPSTKVSPAWSSLPDGLYKGMVLRCFINGTVSPQS